MLSTKTSIKIELLLDHGSPCKSLQAEHQTG
jgi:hypothetical protein